MISRYTLLNFLYTVLAGSPILALSVLLWEGDIDAESVLGFSFACMVVSAICGTPTLVAQLIAVNRNRAMPVSTRLRKSHIAQSVGAMVTFAVIGLGLYTEGGNLLFLLAVVLAYGLSGFILNVIMYRKFLLRQRVERPGTSDVLDFEFDPSNV